MRIRRIKLTNFEGVTASEVSLPATGMVILEGPNEVGKSSMVRAVDLLLTYPHDSHHARVHAACPVHADAGPEVEVELTTGPYHVVYRKRWQKRPETLLSVLAPRPGSLAGRQAHDRMKAILAETLDETLYQALRYIQGSQVGQGPVGSSTTLVAALDRAAAGGAADPRAESTLWEAIQAERLRYVTPTGRPTQEREQLGVDLAAAVQALADIDGAIAALESTGEQYRRVLAERDRAAARHAEADALLGTAREEAAAISTLQSAAETRRALFQAAELATTEARRAVDDRAALIDSITAAEGERHALSTRQRDAEGAAGAALAALDAAQQAQSEAEAGRDRAVERRATAEADLAYHRAVVSDRLLSTRLLRIGEAREREVKARAVLEACTVTDAARPEVEAAWNRLREANVALEVGSPSVTVTALAAVGIDVDGTGTDLSPGETRFLTVTGSTIVSVPGLLSVTVAGGASGDDLRHAAADAKRSLALLVDRYRLDADDPLRDLTGQLARRARAEQDLEHAAGQRADALDDLTETELQAKAAHARSVVADYPTTRDADHPLPPSIDEAASVVDDCRHQVAAADRQLVAARVRVDDARQAFGDARRSAATAGEELQRTCSVLQAAQTRLDESRAVEADDVLAERKSMAEEAQAAAAAELESAMAALRTQDPESTRLRLENAQGLVRRIDQEVRTLDDERVRLRTLLAQGGADDLQARRDQADTRVTDLHERHGDLERRATAALRLQEVFLHHRDRARQAYVAPYREQVEALARLVFGSDVVVDVDPTDLSIVSRTVGGRTIPYESLSTGAQEQLAVLARLACAILVNPDGAAADAGVPVILDDALGNTDATRLAALAPAFSEAAGRTQIIALSSNALRYAAVGNATVVHLRGSVSM